MRRKGRSRTHDVIVVGAGPAGSVLAWELARQGVKVLVVDGASFPRDKVCGDYVEPRGLRVLERMKCLDTVKQRAPLPISRSATFVNGRRLYRGPIPFYGVRTDMPSCGYIIPRLALDDMLLRTAARAGAAIEQASYATGVRATAHGVEVDVRQGRTSRVVRAALVAGADGVNSIVARSAGLLVNDPRYIAVAQRAYADGVAADEGEAAFFFDSDLFPGYGWAFPMAGGRLNLGVGVLDETRERLGILVPLLFRTFLARLRKAYPRFRKVQLCRPPVGGIVKTYGGAGPNHFAGGVLVGDAGSFVDPMTGEGISPAMESSLLAAGTLRRALDTGRFDRSTLSAYEREFRAYFDPAMAFLDLVAATLRNRHMKDWWLSAFSRGCREAQRDGRLARVTGACFGGVELDPRGVLLQVFGRAWSDAPTFVGDSIRWQMDWWRSFAADPLWHASWAIDVQKKWLRVLSILGTRAGDPRAVGVLR